MSSHPAPDSIETLAQRAARERQERDALEQAAIAASQSSRNIWHAIEAAKKKEAEEGQRLKNLTKKKSVTSPSPSSSSIRGSSDRSSDITSPLARRNSDVASLRRNSEVTALQQEQEVNANRQAELLNLQPKNQLEADAKATELSRLAEREEHLRRAFNFWKNKDQDASEEGKERSNSLKKSPSTEGLAKFPRSPSEGGAGPLSEDDPLARSASAGRKAFEDRRLGEDRKAEELIDYLTQCISILRRTARHIDDLTGYYAAR